MNDTEMLLEAIKTESQKIDEAMRRDIESLKPHVDPLLVEVLEYGLFNGGKRVRPLLTVLSARMCGYEGDDAYELAKAFEYLHAATLFHDDVIDNAQTRRGRPAVNRQFGLVSAILAGDFLHARSMEIVGRMVGEKGLSIFCDATSGMVDGEFMQLRNAVQLNLSEHDYYNAIMGKTGLLIAASCEVGAIFGGGNDTQQNALREYGVGLGCAFQMVDDLLDFTGDEQKTGKPVGNDLAEGKMTLPVIITLNRASEEEKTWLHTVLEDQDHRCNELQAVKSLIESCDGFVETRSQAIKSVTQAIEQLHVFSSQDALKDKALLTSLAGYVLSREK
ncbi:polyprenyl synthetase family protein [Desulfosediminicola flagellatus]|uniref:polyprenyl synthetase family protein n=1 Tax=Desulfosediminicola flagellatus TaxID=2569541 RepID=UPI0010AC98C6|nr:polyprenyl synthetase family protein [Desulfosediminicola flagellatus]